MSDPSPLLMIPGPIEISPAVLESCSGAPPSHLAPRVIEAFGASVEKMREVWLADPESQPFVVAGGGTLAMDMAAANLVEPGDAVAVVNTGYFSDRMAEMLRRHGAQVTDIRAPVGEAPAQQDVTDRLDQGEFKALFATHVDTSTGVRVDAEALCRIASARGMLSIFDGVCATAAERFRMSDWKADVYLTASQKALGLPAGLALMVVSRRALEVRESRRASPTAMYLDWQAWSPIMQAYEARRPSYFSTPATNLIVGLETALTEILADGMEARFDLHESAAGTMRKAWAELGLSPIPTTDALTANTLSALRYPDGVDASLVGRVMRQGVVIAGGLHPEIKDRYFRVGHMGYAATRPDMLERTVRAIGAALA